MITLLTATSIVASLLLGWHGYRASLRIAAWGQALNEQDDIFRSVINQEHGIDSPQVWTHEDATVLRSAGNQHLPLGRPL